jgi:hypothetical protein
VSGPVLHRWHRRFGVAAGVFLAWLALSGLLLNHSPFLGLDRARSHASWLLHLYGLQAAPVQSGWNADGHWLVVAGDAVALDGHAMQPAPRAPLGMVTIDRMLAVATPDSVLLLTTEGERVEELRSPTLPLAAITRIGRAGSQIAIEDGAQRYASADAETWTTLAADTAVTWSRAEPLPANRMEALAGDAAPSVTIEQALHDAHSGRLFGRFGTLVVDLVAIAALVLAGSGLWMYTRRLRRAAHIATLHHKPH